MQKYVAKGNEVAQTDGFGGREDVESAPEHVDCRGGRIREAVSKMRH